MSTTPRSPFALAALATVAVPGLDPVAVRGANSGDDFDVAIVVDATDRRWIVRAPKTAIASAALEGEVTLLANLAEAVDGGLVPFIVPRPRGFAALIEGGRAMVYPHIRGHALNVSQLSPALATGLARAIAALHNLPIGIVADAGLPVYSASEYRERRLAEVDEAAATGRVPVSLLQRWEQALEDVRLWRFMPTIVHGDLVPEHILIDGSSVNGIIDWSDARIADPADDLALLLSSAPEEVIDILLDSYETQRGVNDPYLLARAVLASELALVRWLMHGVRNEEPSIIHDATGMLADLATATADTDPIPLIGVDAPPEQAALPEEAAPPGLTEPPEQAPDVGTEPGSVLAAEAGPTVDPGDAATLEPDPETDAEPDAEPDAMPVVGAEDATIEMPMFEAQDAPVSRGADAPVEPDALTMPIPLLPDEEPTTPGTPSTPTTDEPTTDTPRF